MDCNILAIKGVGRICPLYRETNTTRECFVLSTGKYLFLLTSVDRWMQSNPESPWSQEQLVRLLHEAVVETVASSQDTTVGDHSRCSIILGEDGKLLRVEDQMILALDSEQELETIVADAVLDTSASEPASLHDQSDSITYEESQSINDPKFEHIPQTSVENSPSNPIDTSFLSAKLDFSELVTFQVCRPTLNPPSSFC
jgi:hypothetical protein